jgi:hypothetical protein
LAGQQFVLAVLERAELEGGIEHVWRVLAQHALSEREEVVRLAEMGDPRPLPRLEQAVRVAIRRSGVALEHEHAPSAAREGKRRRKTGQPGPEHDHISPLAAHVSTSSALAREWTSGWTISPEGGQKGVIVDVRR